VPHPVSAISQRSTPEAGYRLKSPARIMIERSKRHGSGVHARLLGSKLVTSAFHREILSANAGGCAPELSAGTSCGIIQAVRRRPALSEVDAESRSSRPRWILIFMVLFLWLPNVEALADDPAPLPDLKQGTPATSTSLKQFPQNLGRNFLSLFSKKNIAPLLIGGAASGIVAPFDREIQDHVAVKGESSNAGKIGGVLGGAAVVVPAVTGLLIAGSRSKNDRFHSFTYSLAQAAVLNEGLVQGFKYSVGRTRPDGSDNRSFPSGHAANAFMAATVVQRYYGTKAGIIGYTAAAFIAYSRCRENKHWASDITAGATLGYIVGSSVSRRTGISLRVGKIALVPVFGLGSRRVGINFVSTRN
jgi:membrane-associated phospholipid phosphatase